MFLHIMVNQLCEQLTIIISHANMLFYPLYYDIIKLSLTCLNITQVFYLLRESNCLEDFKIQNSVQITKGSNNRDSDNGGPTIL